MRMTKMLAATVLVGVVWTADHATTQAQTTAFVGVNVVPMDKETVLKDQTVVIQDGRIAAMGPSKQTQVPAGAVRVEGQGKFLMPALAEMHAHIPGGQAPDSAVERTLFLYAANGIGTIRGMLGDPRHLVYRDRIAKGEFVSPRIYTSGPSFNGNTAPTVEVAVASVIAQKKAGYDLLKIHPGVTRQVFDALAAKAHELSIPFAGHVPLDVGLHRALDAKYRSIDHLDGYVEALAKNPSTSQFFGVNLMAEIDETKIPALVAATKAAGTWQVPTQVLMDNLMSDEAPERLVERPEMKYVAPQEQIKKWIAQKENFLEQITAADRQKFLTLRRRLIKTLFDAGVPFGLGSDAPQVWNVPGFSAHRELSSLVAAGLTPYQALRTGTVNVGEYFGTQSTTGIVGTGRRADLLLLDANPLQDISNSTKIAGVMLNGRWLSRAELDKRLANGS
jgi:imidazolonepropionase-like amidohydrolase